MVGREGEDRKRKIMLTPEEWAEEQLKNAPIRSSQWAMRVARIYGLEISDFSEAQDEILP
jgi:hypothetical protein